VMSDQPGPEELTGLAKLLHNARVTTPIPPDIAARIDQAIAQEYSKGSGVPDTEPNADPDIGPDIGWAPSTPHHRQNVVPIWSRSSTLTKLLVAAAVVVGGAVIVPQMMPSSSEDSSAETANTGEGALDTGAPEAGSAATDGDTPAPVIPSEIPSVDITGLRARATELYQSGSLVDRGRALRSGSGYEELLPECQLSATVKRGRVVQVLLEGQPAWLLYTERKNRIYAQLYTCSSPAKPVKTVRVSGAE
jgi:hypothetical protein